ncbi:hypothetical protein NE237_020448 [Protea cynaroides]|uniref:Uncharacterized protein n=1 Tax=Protea cynaroides TaxID=273540 RepID=A0A9Q0H6N5_9MAGN|nr:hypothetical protein NE237_020448 [Protea cynaroides]
MRQTKLGESRREEAEKKWEKKKGERGAAKDVSNIREVPNHQEVLVDPAHDESLIFELLDLKHDVQDNRSVTWFLQDLVTEQDDHKGYTSLTLHKPAKASQGIKHCLLDYSGQGGVENGYDPVVLYPVN